jgi:hypothetical protein
MMFYRHFSKTYPRKHPSPPPSRGRVQSHL